jgi:hypothetical protein
MEVGEHQHIDEKLGLLNVTGPLQEIKKSRAVRVIREDRMAGITYLTRWFPAY